MLRQLYEQNLAEQQKEHGEFDAHTAQAARDLGLFLRSHDDPDNARAALTHAVAIDEKVFGVDAPRTLADVADLATVAAPTDAESLFKRAATSSDPAAASRALVALGEMHAAQHDRAGAGKYWRAALEKQEPGSQNSAVIMNVLAQVLEPEDAIPLLRKALAIDKKIFGPTYPEVGAVDQLLAAALLATGKAPEAVPLARESVSILETQLGPRHPRTLIAVTTLANSLRAAGNFPEAERYYRQALTIDEALYGPQHPGTLETVRTLAQFLRERGKTAEADALEHRLIVNVAQ